jgi:hypothetical protein
MLAGAGAFAQTFPAVDIFAGYSYDRIPREPGGLTAASLNGWNAGAKLNFRPRAALVFDFSGSYGHRRMVPAAFQPRETRDGAVRHQTVLIGPEIRLLKRNRLTANARALIGAVYVDTLKLPLKEPFTPGPDQPLVTEFTIGPAKPLAGALGASLDYRISDRLSVRLFQSDLIVVSLGGLNLKRLRISTGVVFTFDGF